MRARRADLATLDPNCSVQAAVESRSGQLKASEKPSRLTFFIARVRPYVLTAFVLTVAVGRSNDVPLHTVHSLAGFGKANTRAQVVGQTLIACKARMLLAFLECGSPLPL